MAFTSPQSHHDIYTTAFRLSHLITPHCLCSIYIAIFLFSNFHHRIYITAFETATLLHSAILQSKITVTSLRSLRYYLIAILPPHFCRYQSIATELPTLHYYHILFSLSFALTIYCREILLLI